MSHSKERLDRAKRYVDRAVRWIRDHGRYASRISDQGCPDQGDALSWKLKDGTEEKYWFRTIDAKEAHQWTDERPPDSWEGLMLTRDGQLHGDWVYIVINQPMTALALIDMKDWSTDLAVAVPTKHPETGEPQTSMRMPMHCFKFYDLPQETD